MDFTNSAVDNREFIKTSIGNMEYINNSNGNGYLEIQENKEQKHIADNILKISNLQVRWTIFLQSFQT